MEEFLKSYFVQKKQLIFEELGILSLNIIPAYFDTQNQQLFSSYFNYAFSPTKNLKNDTLFFDIIAQYLNISNQDAQQLYKHFTSNLIAEFKINSSFKIPHLAIVRHVNNAYLVEIDSNLQIVFNPIGVNEKKINHKTFTTTSVPIHISLPQRIDTTPQPNKQSIIQLEPSPITPKHIIVEVEKQQLPLSIDKKSTMIRESKTINNTLSTRKKEEPVVTISHNTINRIIIYFLIVIILIALLLIGIKFWIFNDTNFLSSLWQ